MTLKARVRGVYSTAMTRMLLDNRFEIVQPSLAIKERFKFDENIGLPDLDIYDERNRQGVHVVGTAESIGALRTILLDSLMDVICRRQTFPVDGVYKGTTKKEDGEEGYLVPVDIGPVVGKLARNEVDEDRLDGVMVQVQRSSITTERPLLSTRISIPGEYAVLIPERKIKVSLKISDMQKRTTLIELGKKLASSDWGITWRTRAAKQPARVLESEIFHLSETWKLILKRVKEEKAPALLWGNKYYMNVEFPALSKLRLDEMRAQITPTINGHHYYKACGKMVSAALEMAERMLESDATHEDVERLFQKTIEPEYPVEGSPISVEHVKPDGKVYNLGWARIEKCEDSGLVYSRVFETKGTYDDLATPKEPGDRAVTEAKVGEWHYITRYFSRDGVFKGAHVNVNTPLELYPRWIRYVDLEVDICALPDGTVKVFDEDELKQRIANGYISEKLAYVVEEKVGEILENSKSLYQTESKPTQEQRI